MAMGPLPAGQKRPQGVAVLLVSTPTTPIAEVTSILPPSGVAAKAVRLPPTDTTLAGVKPAGTGRGTSMTSLLLASATQRALALVGGFATGRSRGSGMNLFGGLGSLPEVIKPLARSSSSTVPA